MHPGLLAEGLGCGLEQFNEVRREILRIRPAGMKLVQFAIAESPLGWHVAFVPEVYNMARAARCVGKALRAGWPGKRIEVATRQHAKEKMLAQWGYSHADGRPPKERASDLLRRPFLSGGPWGLVPLLPWRWGVAHGMPLPLKSGDFARAWVCALLSAPPRGTHLLHFRLPQGGERIERAALVLDRLSPDEIRARIACVAGGGEPGRTVPPELEWDARDMEGPELLSSVERLFE
jgi:hypothetical protein